MKKLLPLFLVLFATAAVAQTPKEVESRLVGYLQELERVSNYGGSGDYEAQSRINKQLRDTLVKIGTRSDILAYSFPKLSKKMFVTTSKDGRFRAYSWDSQSGGSMHNFLTVYHYRKPSGKAGVWAHPYSDDISDYGIGSFVHQIFQSDTRVGRVYMVVSTFIGSTSLAGQSLNVFRVTNNKLDRDVKIIRTASGLTSSIGFGYDFFSVFRRPERPIKLFEFNETRKEFKFPVVIEDEEAPQGRVTDKFISYRYDGKYFVKVK